MLKWRTEKWDFSPQRFKMKHLKMPPKGSTGQTPTCYPPVLGGFKMLKRTSPPEIASRPAISAKFRCHGMRENGELIA